MKAILSVINGGEKIRGCDITGRLKNIGYEAIEGNINMFIYHYMLHRYIDREKVNGINYYFSV